VPLFVALNDSECSNNGGSMAFWINTEIVLGMKFKVMNDYRRIMNPIIAEMNDER
jgi:hypothetical protein